MIKASANKLRLAQSATKQRMLGVWKTNECIRQLTRVNDVMKRIELFKWKWAGHIAKITVERYNKTIRNWTPPTKNKNDRPIALEERKTQNRRT